MIKKMQKHIFFSIFTLLCLILSTLTLSYGATTRSLDKQLELKFDFILNEDITEIAIKNLEEYDNSSGPEIIVAAGKSIYIFNNEGKLLKNFSINTKGNIYTIGFLDVNNDGIQEIIAGSGWIESVRVKKSYLNQSDMILSRKVENKGRIDVVDINEGSIASKDVDFFVKKIIVDSLLLNENKTIVAAGGGINTYYYEIWGGEGIITKKCSDFNAEYNETFYSYQPKGYDCEPVHIGGLICYKECIPSEYIVTTTTTSTTTTQTTTTTTTIEEGEITCDDRCLELYGTSGTCRDSCLEQENDVGTSGCSPNSRCCCVKTNLPTTTTTYRIETNLSVSFTSNTLSLGKILLLDNYLNITNEFTTEGVIWDISVSNLFNDLDKEIIVGGDGKIFVLDYNISSFLWTYSLPDSSSRSIVSGEIGESSITQIVASIFPSFDVPTLYLLDRDGNAKWQFRVPLREKLRAIKIGNMDLDSENEILFATSRNIYALSLEGALESKISFSGIQNFEIGDIDKDEYQDIIVSLGKYLYCYEFSGKGSRKAVADSWYEKAKNFIGNYSKAKDYAKRAKSIYVEINDTEGIKKSELLIQEIEKKIWEKEKNSADSLYTKSISSFAFEDYASAKDYAKRAKIIYQKINHTEGIERCSKLLSQVDDILKSTDKETTTTSLTKQNNITTVITTTISFYITSTTTMSQKTPLEGSVFSIVISFLLILLLIFLFLRWRWKKEEKKEKEEFESVS
jgi:hypothetical protein